MVLFTENGGADRVLYNSVEILQANNMRINTTTDDSCEFLRQTVEDWVATVGMIRTRQGVSLHLLHFTLEPIRCDALNSTQICMSLCEPQVGKMLNSNAACHGWTIKSEEERIKWYEDWFDVRPNDIYMEQSEVVPMNYSLPNGTVVEAEFFVMAQFNETVPVKQT
jgi:hypothetical protein